MPAADPALKSSPTDNEYNSFYKIVDLLNQLVPSLDLQPAPADPSTGSLQKINALLWQMLDAPWADCTMQSGWTGPLKARVNMSRIEFLGIIQSSVALTTTAVVIATLPSSIVPTALRETMAPGGTASNPACSVGLAFGTDGNIAAAAFNNNDNATHVWIDGVSVPL